MSTAASATVSIAAASVAAVSAPAVSASAVSASAESRAPRRPRNSAKAGGTDTLPAPAWGER